jgi:uncharacterized protein (DUF2147 family)
MRVQLAAVMALIVSAVPAQAITPVGTWVTQDGKGRVRVTKCGDKLCGSLIWFHMPPEHSSVPMADVTDAKNANAGLRGRKLLGSPVLIDMKAKEGSAWQGHIYNADDGRTYDATISLAGPNTLRVRGCAMGGWVCGTQSWSRIQ